MHKILVSQEKKSSFSEKKSDFNGKRGKILILNGKTTEKRDFQCLLISTDFLILFFLQNY